MIITSTLYRKGLRIARMICRNVSRHISSHRMIDSTYPQGLGNMPNTEHTLNMMRPINNIASNVTVTEETQLLEDKRLNPPALFGDPPGPVPPSYSKSGFDAFLEDCKDFQSGSVPVTFVIATVIGVSCGVTCFVYYELLKGGVKLFWDTLPNIFYEPYVHEDWHWTWIPLVVMSFSLAIGVTLKFVGDPGGTNEAICHVHDEAHIPISVGPKTALTSIISLVGAGSLGPEAPVVDICACVSTFVSRVIFKQKYKNLVRRYTLCGMAAGCAAFFGVPLGGAMFALEQTNRFGYEYFEHAIASVYSGTICLAVFRNLAGLGIGPVWRLTKSAREAAGGKFVERFANATLNATATIHRYRHDPTMDAYENVTEIVNDIDPPQQLVAEIVSAHAKDMVLGIICGLVGALAATCFQKMYKSLARFMKSELMFQSHVTKAMFGGAIVCSIGLIFPQTFFWGEFEFETIAVEGDSVKELPHLWPHGGLSNFEITGFFSALAVGFAKLAAISFSAAGGYKGGLIFPLYCAGSAFGRAMTYVITKELCHPVITILSVTAGLHVTITRTSLATPLILPALAGEPCATPPVLAASMAAMFATNYLPFYTQRGRDNLFEANLYSYTFDEADELKADKDLDRLETPDLDNAHPIITSHLIEETPSAR